MSKNSSQSTFDPSRGIKKFFLSAFVVVTFIAYAIHERLSSSNPSADSGSSSAGTSSGQDASQPAASQLAASQPASNPSSSNPASNDSASNPGSVASKPGSYKDGVYTGPQVNVFYGLVQVQATVQNGKLSQVQFLEYPNDRRTSVQINNIAMPYLQQEALQTQSANVDIISGATLTSEGFSMSLQSALGSAK